MIGKRGIVIGIISCQLSGKILGMENAVELKKNSHLFVHSFKHRAPLFHLSY